MGILTEGKAAPLDRRSRGQFGLPLRLRAGRLVFPLRVAAKFGPDIPEGRQSR